eukprot:TRINITY_DN828_c0_g1_i9.p1 TRINITY_DN828_c0_g1~~TRINITY_DN828_c0_g1_i9.p1  ORF type:complete len:424 (-),score=119.40 TRINITY_DN828_c0_g1_i9:408-1679(-)
MLRSLVGSEMCIRDRVQCEQAAVQTNRQGLEQAMEWILANPAGCSPPAAEQDPSPERVHPVSQRHDQEPATEEMLLLFQLGFQEPRVSIALARCSNQPEAAARYIVDYWDRADEFWDPSGAEGEGSDDPAAKEPESSLPRDAQLLEVPELTAPQRKRIVALARVLAHGAITGYWGTEFHTANPSGQGHQPGELLIPKEPSDGGVHRKFFLIEYLKQQWKFLQPRAELLVAFGFMESRDGVRTSQKFLPSPGSAHHTLQEVHTPVRYFVLTPKAFELLTTAADKKIFLSYKRSESSALALLLYEKLRTEGYSVFLDLQNMDPGERWRDRLRAEVLGCDVFVGLVGPTTLTSGPTREEIEWGAGAECVCVPVWHNEFEGSLPEGTTVSLDVARFVRDSNALVVKPEDPLGYEAVIKRLMQFLERV